MRYFNFNKKPSKAKKQAEPELSLGSVQELISLIPPAVLKKVMSSPRHPVWFQDDDAAAVCESRKAADAQTKQGLHPLIHHFLENYPILPKQSAKKKGSSKRAPAKKTGSKKKDGAACFFRK